MIDNYIWWYVTISFWLNLGGIILNASRIGKPREPIGSGDVIISMIIFGFYAVVAFKIWGIL